MGLDISVYQVCKEPFDITNPDIDEFSLEWSNAKFLKQMEKFISYKEAERDYIHWHKTLKANCLTFDDIKRVDNYTKEGIWLELKNVQDNPKLIPIKSVYYHKTIPFVYATEIIYQRKNVGDIYHEWLGRSIEYKGEDVRLRWTPNERVHYNSYVYDQKDFEEVYQDYREEEYSELENMYLTLKDEDTFLYNSW
jgi:hypothetical protein